jgi:hypothetical protein
MSIFDAVLADIRAGDYDQKAYLAEDELNGSQRLRNITKKLLEQKRITPEEHLSLLVEWTKRQDELVRALMSRHAPEPPTVSLGK